MNWTERRKRFRAIIAGNQCVYPGSVFDALSARAAEDIGFEIGMFAGSVASLAIVGGPDIAVITLSEFADQAYRICRAGNLALMVDADHGYGNALNVRRTVEELETAGVSGLSIEDTELPAAFGAGTKATLLSKEEGVGKMKAAVSARQDPDLVIAGRTSAISITGLDDTIVRVQAYEACGVDALFIVGMKTREQLETVFKATKAPLILGGVPADMMDREYLSSRRVRICLTGHQPFMASVQAAYSTLKALRDGTDPAKLPGVAPVALMKQLTRDADYAKWAEEYLGGK
ncbi:MAG TPA: isocitrate lyase/phosphoenolpyruvate mutase family protein [Burkholderiales bacterium]|jgi:carboxyvinyl-carboxyphosphonate phosphorylmutase